MLCSLRIIAPITLFEVNKRSIYKPKGMLEPSSSVKGSGQAKEGRKGTPINDQLWVWKDKPKGMLEPSSSVKERWVGQRRGAKGLS